MPRRNRNAVARRVRPVFRFDVMPSKVHNQESRRTKRRKQRQHDKHTNYREA